MGIKQSSENKTWEAFYSKRHPTTRQPVSLRRKGIATKAEASRVEKELVLEVEERLRAAIIPTWRKLVADFIDDCYQRDLRKNTIVSYQAALEACTMEQWNDRLIDRITTEEIRELVKIKLERKSRSYKKNILKFTKAVFNFAIQNGSIQRNPVPDIHFREGDKIKAVLTEEQVKLFLNKARELNAEWYSHWILAVFTGMRSGELYALPWNNVDLENRLILVNSAWNNKDGFKSTKSGDDRWLEIAQILVPYLKELKLQTGTTEFVLPRLKSWDKGEQARELRMFLMGMGLPPLRFHDLRATWATILLNRGVVPIKVMKMAGWKDLKTMQIYIRKAGVDIKGITDGLNMHDPMAKTGKVIRLMDKATAGML